MSPLSSSNSFSSVDTNQTLLNSIANQQHILHQQQKQQQLSNVTVGNRSVNITSSTGTATNRSYRTKYSQFMIITPAVSIDRDFEQETSGISSAEATAHNITTESGIGVTITPVNTDNADLDDAYFNNGNIFRMSLLQSSIDSGNSSDSSFRSNYNPYVHTSRQHLLPKAAPQFYTFPSWRWCTLICAAMRCFGGGRNSNGTYSTSFTRPPYQRSRSSGGGVGYPNSSMPHRRFHSSSSFTAETAFEHFSAPFKPRKTRDHLNNITYEL